MSSRIGLLPILGELERDRQEQSRKWDEQSQRWDENKREFDRVLSEIQAVNRKHDSTIRALGARWGYR